MEVTLYVRTNEVSAVNKVLKRSGYRRISPKESRTLPEMLRKRGITDYKVIEQICFAIREARSGN